MMALRPTGVLPLRPECVWIEGLMPELSPKAGLRVSINALGAVQSPAFQTHYPRIVNEELIHLGPKRTMLQSWDQNSFGAREADVFRIGGPTVIGEGLLLDRDMQVIENASDRYSDTEVAEWLDVIRNRPGKIQQIGGLTIMAKRRAAHNYGHFLIDIL